MNQPFNADEIFEIAEQIERNGARFYRRAAELAGDDEAAAALLDLAGMEDDHERTFAAMREEARREHPDWLAEPFAVDGGNEAVLYLQAIAQGRVFDLRGEPAAQLSGAESLHDLLTIAIGLEKDSIVFYLGIKEAVPESLGRGKLDDIIREEMGHVALLSGRRAALST